MLKYTTYIALLTVGCSAYHPWNYASQDSWYETYPECNGKKQSPVNLIKNDAIEIASSPIIFENYATKLERNSLVLSNNGYSAELMFDDIPSDIVPQITGGILGNQTYILEQLHFHWGNASNRGSDHTIDFKQYDLEAHLVHRNTEYESVSEAFGKESGVVVLAFLYEEKSLAHSHIKQITDLLHSIKQEGSSNATITGDFETEKNFPVEEQEHYFNYDGSLTVPGCSENVNWIVFDKIQSISTHELEKFRDLENSHGNPISDNYRKIRDLNGRSITYVKTTK